jgi:leader peptidase (prepilin peptidase) / N-methyltransferase
MESLILIFIILGGLVLGSFFNVLILRLPKNEMFSHARSICPHCGKPIRFYDNIPVISFLLLKRKCRDCGAPISWQYPLVELSTALLAVLLFIGKRWPPDSPFLLVSQAGTVFAFLFLLPVTIIDMRHRIIPDSITLGGLGLGLLLSLLPGGLGVKDAFLGALCGGGGLFLTGFIGDKVMKKETMGGGDIKLMAMAGAFLGVKLVLIAFFFGSFIGAVAGLVIKLRSGRSDIAFGPALSAGIILAYLFGDSVFRWYMGLL